MSQWESRYHNAARGITAPSAVDNEILAQARKFKPIKSHSRVLPKMAAGFMAFALMIALLYPAQYLDAFTPIQRSPLNAENDTLSQWRADDTETRQKNNEWRLLRIEINAGNFLNLCSLWRRQQRLDPLSSFPRDLARKARKHCRLLPGQ